MRPFRLRVRIRELLNFVLFATFVLKRLFFWLRLCRSLGSRRERLGAGKLVK